MKNSFNTSTTTNNPVPMDIRKIKLSNIAPNPSNARKNITNINPLSQSIAAIGLQQPIVVRPAGNGKFMVVAGMRRFLACQRLKWDEIDCKVIENNAELAECISLAENVERKNLSSKEKADKIAELQMRTGFAQSNRAMAKEIGVSEAYIRKLLKIKNLPTDVQEKIENKELSQNAALKMAGKRQSPDPEVSPTINPRSIDENDANSLADGSDDNQKRDETNPGYPDASNEIRVMSPDEFNQLVNQIVKLTMKFNVDDAFLQALSSKHLEQLTDGLGNAVQHIDGINNRLQNEINDREYKRRGVPKPSVTAQQDSLPAA